MIDFQTFEQDVVNRSKQHVIDEQKWEQEKSQISIPGRDINN